MATQLQLRRGTTAENDAFTGAIGEVTMDTEKNQLRVHDGVTQGGAGIVDPVVDFQVPTAQNNYTWYRKYRSGWVEQGGITTTDSGNPCQVTLPVEMADSYYNINILGQTGTDGYSNAQWHVMSISSATTPKTTTKFYGQPSITGYNLLFYWEVRGMAA